MIYTLGIDPGQTGGIAIVSEDLQDAKAWRYPEDVQNAMDLLGMIKQTYDVRLVVIEKVSAMPKQGVVSMFKFGLNYGAWIGGVSALGLPHIMVTPQKWQKAMLDAGTGETKARSLNMARRLFPDVDMRFKKDNGKSDALHLARYALTQLRG